MRALVDADDGDANDLADLGERVVLGKVVRQIGRVDAALERLSDEDDRALVGRVREHAAGQDLADGERVKVEGLERELLALGLAVLLGLLGRLLGFVRDEREALCVVLCDDDELVERLAEDDGRAGLVGRDAARVGEVADRQERLGLRRLERQQDVLGVDGGDRARDDVADLDASEARDGRRRLGRSLAVLHLDVVVVVLLGARPVGLPDRRANLARGRVDRRDADADGLSNVVGVGEVLDKVVGGLCDRDERAQAAVQVDDGASLEHLGDDAVGDGPDLGGLPVGDDRQVRLKQRLLERERDAVLLGLGREDLGEGRMGAGQRKILALSRDGVREGETHAALDRRANLEPALGLLKHDVGPVERPGDAVDVAADVDKQGLWRQALDGALEDVADLDVVDLEERLGEDGRLEREADEAVDERPADHTRLVRRADREGSRGARERRRVGVGDVRDVDKAVGAALAAREGNDESPVGLDADDTDALDNVADVEGVGRRGRREADDGLGERQAEADLLVGRVGRPVQHARADLAPDLVLVDGAAGRQGQVEQVDRAGEEAEERQVEAPVREDGRDEARDERAGQDRRDVGDGRELAGGASGRTVGRSASGRAARGKQKRSETGHARRHP